MLLSLHVKNIALIDEIEVDFFDHLNIMTGETGAGKSIIIGSIKAALGAKVSKDIIREGKEYALIELLFHIEDEKLANQLRLKDVYLDDNKVCISRKIMENRSVSRINGETVTLAQVKEIGQLLLDIHGQHEHQSLLRESSHLDVLDRYSALKFGDLMNQYQVAYTEYRKAKKEYDSLTFDEERRKRDLEYLSYELDEIEKVRLVPGEDEELESYYRKQNNSKEMMEALDGVHSICSVDDRANVSDLIGQAMRGLSLIEDIDDTTKDLYQQLSVVDSLVNDFNRELADYMNEMTFDQERFHETEERLNVINHMKSRYGNSVEAILSYYDEQKEKLDKLKNYEQYEKQVVQEYEAAKEKAKKIDQELLKIRKKSAETLAKEMEQALIELNFLQVKCEIDLIPTELTAKGGVTACFKISTNPGQPLRPISQVASGGELSRIMLAIKSVLAQVDDIPTLVFDEIDQGISGRTAQLVAEKMATIARGHQLICITHLAQIAAMADSHFRIEKQMEDDTTTTNIRMLYPKEEVEELARILGGAKITDAVLENAKEMKQLARETKNY